MISSTPTIERLTEIKRILATLTASRGQVFSSLVTGFRRRWLDHFPRSRIEETIMRADSGWWEARVSMPMIMLRGFGDFILVVTSEHARPDELNRLAGKHVIFILANDRCRLEFETHPGWRHWLLFSGESAAELFESSGVDAFLSAVRESISAHSLIPFQTTRPAVGPMFRGRRKEVESLLEDDEVCYALIGPSRIGKTSIARQFMHELRVTRDPRAERLYFINLQELPEANADAAANLIAAKIDTRAQTTWMGLQGLPTFLKRQAMLKKGPLQLILDEADAICGNALFELLCDLSRDAEPCVRVTWIGRGKLLHDLCFAGSAGSARVQPLRPEPLPDEDAWQLFARPLLQWGAAFEDEERLRAEVLRRSSGLPHLVQELGRSVCDAICNGASQEISVQTLADAADKFLGMSRLIGHVNDIRSPEARLAAYVVLLVEGEHGELSWTPERLTTAVAKFGQRISTQQAVGVQTELALHHFLTWRDRQYFPGRWDFRRIACRNTETLLRLIKEHRHMSAL